MNIVAETIIIDKFDMDKGINKIENQIQSGVGPDWNHVVAYRMTKEEIMYAWLSYIKDVVKQFFITQGILVGDRKDSSTMRTILSRNSLSIQKIWNNAKN